MSNQIAVHASPCWQDRADFLIRANLAGWGLPGWTEQLWARSVSERQFELCCIPFLPYGMRLGYIVRAEADPNSGVPYLVDDVIRPGGRTNVRIAVPDATLRETLAVEITQSLDALDCLYEVYKPGYIALDVPKENALQDLYARPDNLIQAELLMIEDV